MYVAVLDSIYFYNMRRHMGNTNDQHSSIIPLKDVFTDYNSLSEPLVTSLCDLHNNFSNPVNIIIVVTA